MDETIDARERAKHIAAEFIERGDALGWFDALYAEAAGDNEKIPWADLEPNRFFHEWAEKYGLKGKGSKALVVGCGLGDDARYLYDLGFEVTAFDLSPTAIEWAKRLHGETDIRFEVMDLFEPPESWFSNKISPANAGGTDGRGCFDFVLEVYTIQPLPLEMRPSAIRAIAAFVAPGGELVVVTRGREGPPEPDEFPFPLSLADLSLFENYGLMQTHFEIMRGDEDPPVDRYVAAYRKLSADE